MESRNSNGFEELFRVEAFVENYNQKWKNASCGAQFRHFQIK